MLDSILNKAGETLDHVANFLWEQFEKDMALTHDIIHRSERLWARVESFFKDPKDD